MQRRGQTSAEYLLLTGGVLLVAVVAGYYGVSSATSAFHELNAAAGGGSTVVTPPVSDSPPKILKIYASPASVAQGSPVSITLYVQASDDHGISSIIITPPPGTVTPKTCTGKTSCSLTLTGTVVQSLSPGSYTFSATVKDTAGHTVSDSNTFTITPGTLNKSPHAAFTYTVSGTTVDFNASSSYDPDGSIVSYSWDFNDGSTKSGRTVAHTYSCTSGKCSYTVRLTVTDNHGATATATKTVTVTAPDNPPTITNFTCSASGLTVTCSANLGDPDGDILNGSISFDDGSSSPISFNPATDTNPKIWSHPYASAGTYKITLTVSDPAGKTATASQKVSISSPNKPPTASFTYRPSNPVVSVPVDFNASSSYDPDGSIVSYSWDFNDGKTGSGRTVSHIFTAPGSYTVTLAVADDDGAVARASRTITVVADQPPRVTISVSPPGLARDYDQVIISCSGSDDVGLSRITITSGSNTLRVCPVSGTSANCQIAHTFPAGVYKFNCTAQDVAGHVTTSKVTYLVLRSSIGPTPPIPPKPIPPRPVPPWLLDLK
ncbi:MAG: PKD domain-containing protein [Candidatus Diapherotrites archaeon]|nr:PKD domain-containing protein [Candidatus Diapherotrites archaeon]